jgi:hypothetical protein
MVPGAGLIVTALSCYNPYGALLPGMACMQILQEQKSALVQNAMHFVNLTDSSPKIIVLN